MAPAGERAYGGGGMKLTPQRMAIMAYLDGNVQHPSADDVYRAVKGKFPTMSFATVYNTLETLKQRGALIELTSDPGKKRFDPNTRPHHHLICTGCRKIVDVMADIRLDAADAVFAGFQVTGNHIEFTGLCPACQEPGE